VKGKITEWNDSKGYGFISSLTTHKKIFIHILSLQSRKFRPGINDEVEFEIFKDDKDRLNARNAFILKKSHFRYP